MSALWNATEAESATFGTATAPFEACGISIDTRSLRPGDLFVALQGEARDGHGFVPAAFAAGAAAAVVSRDVAGVQPGAPLLRVGHTLRALEDLAAAARTRSSGKVIAVTGSAGKTTTKELLRLACSALGKTHASAASYNNHWGVPLTLAQLPRDGEFAIVEIGMNHFGEIRSLVHLARPHVAVITTIAPAHLEFFGSLEAIADAKSEIFEGITPGGSAILPSDSPLCARLAARAAREHVARILTFGSGKDCDARLISTADHDGGQTVEALVLERPVRLKLRAAGSHIAMNAVAALLAVAEAGGDVLNAAAGMADFAALKGRGARIRIPYKDGQIDVIDESYNANPASMTAALTLLGQAEGRRVAVLGDMLEMGESGPAMHRDLLGALAASGADRVFLNGTQMQALWDVLPADRRGVYAATSAEIVQALLDQLRPNDTILVKGSLGSKMAVVIDALKKLAE